MDEQRVQVAGVRVNKGKNGDNQHTSHQVLLVPVMGDREVAGGVGRDTTRAANL